MLEKLKARQYLNQLYGAVESSSNAIPIFNENRDFVEFEFMFYFFFLFDYRFYHKMKSTLRKTINDIFIGRILEIRKSNFSISELDRLFDNRMEAYLTFMNESKKVSDFLDKASDYINAMLTISIDENGYTDGNLNQLQRIKEMIQPNIFTDLIRQTLSLNSGTML